MRALAAAIVGLLVALLLSQAGEGAPRRRARAQADGGPVLLGTDPPGSIRRTAASDGGVEVARLDAGPTATQRELADLRARVDALERQLQAQQQQAQQLQQIASEVQRLRTQLADAEARRQAEQQEQAQQRSQRESAIAALNQAQSALAGGSYDVSGALDQAEGAFSGQAQRDVQAARAALQNHDLSQARALLNAAILDAQQGR
ncbi:MAG TPA: hypothetical protein VLW85_05765 [Myxococcales bacterium]|nr:hypothetical protein [Myxococcales bacterium]